MSETILPSKFEEYLDARKEGFMAVKEFKENGGKIAGKLSSCNYRF